MEINITLLVQLFMFLLLLVFLSRFLFTPLLSLFDERERRIKTMKADAEKVNATCQQLLVDMEETLANAKKEARDIWYNLRQEGLNSYNTILKTAKDENKKKLQDEQELLKHETEVAKTQLTGALPSLAQAAFNHLWSNPVATGSIQGGNKNHGY